MALRVRGGKSRYDFTPANPQDPIPETEQPSIRQPSSQLSLRDYPPPQQLFQSGEGSLHAFGGTPRCSGSTILQLELCANQKRKILSSIRVVVEAKFYKIIALRMKDMVYKARTKRLRPYWIEKTLWKEMCQYWNTEEAIAKSSTTSAARMSDCNGLGPHKHVSGPKSFLQVEQEMEVELGRPPTIEEVFIRTHTKKDGHLWIGRRKKSMRHISRTRQLSWLPFMRMMNSLMVLLSNEEDNEIFLQSTVTNDRGEYFGVRSLGVYINGKPLQVEREAEVLRVAASQAAEIKHLTMVKKYLSETDPNLLAFLKSQSTPAADDHSEVQATPTLAANPHGTTPTT
ncbi:putative transposase Ptta/En/Spm plant [Arabidopsis thaliana x Arabidopsis arenosa]|uniref:Putative transposase Ptta/En/Spm plant n=1 Tax=Arabidopsis thaliana x Arabidopsis arenosa TaxID=1240361 RepID=A0A8T1ZKX7_9BRAS|nr:putative transposase Ptta/En/Spm plant [Arabidopsis thaliana x Arabidopsis arenosa]